jgi:hypothetical protein
MHLAEANSAGGAQMWIDPKKHFFNSLLISLFSMTSLSPSILSAV